MPHGVKMFNGTVVLEMDFVPTIANPDVYQHPNAKENGFKQYYQYVLVYVDDILILSHDPMTQLETIKSHYEVNSSSIGPPTQYLGADVKKVTQPGNPTGCEYWAFSANTYVKNAVRNVKMLLKEVGRNLKTTAKSPFPSTSYRSETSTTEECDADGASRFSQLIGVLRWAIKLGRIDMYTEVSLLSQHLALPRIGHLETVYHVLAYLQKYDKSSIIGSNSYYNNDCKIRLVFVLQ